MGAQVERGGPPAADARAATHGIRAFDPGGVISGMRRYSALHSHVVVLLKLLLPAAALGLMALVLLWPQLAPEEPRFRLKPVAVAREDLESLRMVNPRFVGSDSQDQPYTVTADMAVQASAEASVTDLVRPKGDITLKDGTWLALSADTGVYRKQPQLLDLTGNVNLFHDDGYEIVTSKARIDLAQSRAEGDAPVVGQGPDMELQGEGFRIEQKGQRIFVTGASRLVIHRSLKPGE